MCPSGGKGRSVGANPENGQVPRAEAQNLGFQPVPSFHELVWAKLLRASGCSLDDISQSALESEQLAVLVWPELRGRDAGCMKGRPESIPGPREMVSEGGRVQTRIYPAEEDGEAGPDYVGEGLRPGGLKVLLGWAHSSRQREWDWRLTSL